MFTEMISVSCEGFVVFLSLQMSRLLGWTDQAKPRLLNLEPGHSRSHYQSSSQMRTSKKDDEAKMLIIILRDVMYE